MISNYAIILQDRTLKIGDVQELLRIGVELSAGTPYNKPPSVVSICYLCSRKFFLSLKLQSDGVIGREVHGVNNSHCSSKLVKSVSNDLFTHANSSTNLGLG